MMADPIRQELIARCVTSEVALRQRLDPAKLDGNLLVDSDPADFACFVATVPQGMAVLAASGVSREELQQIA